MDVPVLCRSLRRSVSVCFMLSMFLPVEVLAQTYSDEYVGIKIKKTDIDGGDGVAASGGIGFYQRFISQARGSRCAMYPSCSNYGLICFEHKPFLEAMAMTADRMIRCGHDGKFYDLTYEYGYPSLIDYPPFEPVPREIVYKPKSFVTTDNVSPKTATDSIKGFINTLINNHSYELALLEIERMAYFKPRLFDHSMYYGKLLCYDGLDREEEGIFDFSVKGKAKFGDNSKIVTQVAKMYYEIGNYKEAVKTLTDVACADSFFMYKKELYRSLSALRMGYEADAYSYMREACCYVGNDIAVRENLQVFESLRNMRKKKPLTAGLLSIIPGMGYLYCGQPGNAITSLLINGLLAYATYTSVKNKNYGIAGVTGVFSLTFYVGNIMGSVNGAKRYNSRRLSESAAMLERINNIY